MDDSLVRSKMQVVMELVNSELSTIRTGRATGAIVEDLYVTVYGGQQKLKIKELGTISATDPQTLTIEPWDKSIAGEIRQGIQKANVGLNPSLDGEIIRISMPPLTTEDREKYVKILSGKLENGKVMIRQIRAEFMKEIKDLFEKKEISEDEKFRQEKKLQELTDEFVENVESTGKKKEEEILHL